MLFDLDQSLADLAKTINHARLAQGWSVADLAERSGVATSTIKRFERSGVITTDRLLLLMMPLGMVENTLLGAAQRDHWSLEQHERLARKLANKEAKRGEKR